MSLVIKILLPADRTKTGTLRVVDSNTGVTVYGPVSVLGRAARNAAKAAGNPGADPLKKNGDTPEGVFNVLSIVRNGAGTSRPTIQYGENGSIVLDPTGGPALTAKQSGRTGLLIHSGRHPNTPMLSPSVLKPTNGCLRMLDWDMKSLIDAIRDNMLLFPGTLTVEVSGSPGPQGDIDETVDDGDPPPLQGPVILP